MSNQDSQAVEEQRGLTKLEYAAIHIYAAKQMHIYDMTTQETDQLMNDAITEANALLLKAKPKN